MKRTVVITTIAGEQNKILRMIRDGCVHHQVRLVVVGDRKSPKGFELERCTYLSVERQAELDYRLARRLPFNHYCRKNLGYLEAVREGSELIIDIDDDNIPKEGFWDTPVREWMGPCIEHYGWVNVYRYFGSDGVWPRGFPLRRVRDSPPPLESQEVCAAKVPIRQGLADENPDVDAIYRMVGKLPVSFSKDIQLALGAGSICPFNSQNTQFFDDAFPLLYLPANCSFRMTDIWRSFVAQIVAWQHGWCVGFMGPTVVQERNEHNLLRDFSEEITGYLHNEEIVEALMATKLDPDVSRIGDNMLVLYETLVREGHVGPEELTLLSEWLEDLSELKA